MLIISAMAHDSSMHSSIQRIARLTPLASVLALIEARVGAVGPRLCGPTQALGATLAQDVTVPELPARAVALRDGYAVEAAAITDAGAYAPLPFATMPRRVDAGDAMPPGTDAVAPLDAVVVRGDRAEAVAAVAPGEGVLPTGTDAAAQMPLGRPGTILRALDIAAMTAAGVRDVSVRSPRLRLARGSAAQSSFIDAALTLLADLIAKAGGNVLGDAISLEPALTDQEADAVVAIGGTGSGRNDGSVRFLAARGRVEVHGIAISPGETAALGWVGPRPVLLLPGRLDAALSGWLLVGRYLLARLASGTVEEATRPLPLKRKVASAIGLTELVPVVCADGMAEPLGSGYLSLRALTRSDGFIVVPADSEGYAAGTPVAVRSWP